MVDRRVLLHMQILEFVARNDEGTTTNKLNSAIEATGYHNKEKVVETRKNLSDAGLLTETPKGKQKIILNLTDFGRDLIQFEKQLNQTYIEFENADENYWSKKHLWSAKTKEEFVKSSELMRLNLTIWNLRDFEMVKILIAVYYHLIFKHAPNESGYEILDRFLVNHLTDHLTGRVVRTETFNKMKEKHEHQIDENKRRTDSPHLSWLATLQAQFSYDKDSFKRDKKAEENKKVLVYPQCGGKSELIYDLILRSLHNISGIRESSKNEFGSVERDNYFKEVIAPMADRYDSLLLPLKKAADSPGTEWQERIVLPTADKKFLAEEERIFGEMMFRGLALKAVREVEDNLEAEKEKAAKK